MSLNFEIVGLDFDFPFMYIKKEQTCLLLNRFVL